MQTTNGESYVSEHVAWLARGAELVKAGSRGCWALGDWLIEGDCIFPDLPGIPGTSVYAVAERITGLSRSYLHDLASTARRMNPLFRTEELSWGHHRAIINALPAATDEDINRWLKRAVDEHLTVRELKAALDPPRQPTLERSLVVTVPLRVWETLADLAACPYNDTDFATAQKYAAQVLSEHCNSPEVQVQRRAAKEVSKKRTHERRSRAAKRNVRIYNPLRLKL